MRILIVEDDVTTLNYLVKGLKEAFFLPDTASNGQDGLHFALNHTYEVIVLDVTMPVLDGFSLLEHIRKAGISTPVLFLTARDQVDDKVKGLMLGADDYLVKPFSFSELVARLRVLARRAQPILNTVFKIGDVVLDVQSHKVTKAGRLLQLSAKEFMLLHLFFKHQGEVLTRTFIAEQVWDIHFDSDTNVIDVAVKRLRDKIEGNSGVKWIHSVRGVGYVFEER